ncbi:ead/Ea22-like family protein [Klebsiella pneumoniae]|uniref:ead/Ea22-like family protein n=1 Tax=Klebsiella pneumoniae TaxID=573 RepID=UPI000E07721D|nr:ead/Ea22-like family protein [Klebsiella pneumoniae]MCF0705305.1 ead/Ea22-like family protein [Klebsiella pneumoniae]MCQ0462581.1 ead/Ea22-like family protein [Klebsiella pneumoniae]STV57015.1 phage EaA protein [Klebsiella pneumoniae]VGK28691.1 phage EaA protein [Klebsiella pneumoniae]
MTTDITELAQSLKAAAEKATPGQWVAFTDTATRTFSVHTPDDARCENIIKWAGFDCQKNAKSNAKFIALANPANILTLVEALEKAQQVDEELCKLLPPGAEYMDPPDGGDVTPLEGVRRMVADYRQRIADLESRTVTVTATATAAAADVLAERKRQVTADGWTPGHDDEYEHGELADAAGCYALSSELFDCAGEPPRPWPWPDEWWKPTNRRRDLVKAGALILAEIERLDRAAGIKVEAE